MTEGSIVTFYSYKGGVGRTMALANIAALLAHWGYKVLCVDWDLEAPGLHLYFKGGMRSAKHAGLTELIQHFADGKKPGWRAYTTQVKIPHFKQPLTVMTAGLQNKTYVPRMQALNWERLYTEHDLGSFLEELRVAWKAEFDFVLLDSRTGITDIGGICTAQLPDLLVLLFTANEQSLSGVVDVFARAEVTRNGLPYDRAKLLALPVATRFEKVTEYELAEQWLRTFAAVLPAVVRDWKHKEVTIQELLDFTCIPYIPYWSFGEELPVIKKGTRDPKDLGYYFETLAALVAQKFAYNDTLVRNRDSYVKVARSGPGDAAAGPARASKVKTKPISIYISYAQKDEKLNAELSRHLKLLGREFPLKITHERMLGEAPRPKAARNAALERADIILLLLSADYLASDYVYDKEVPRALALDERGEAAVVPVILRPMSWPDPAFERLQIVPYNGVPVSSWANRDEAWVQVVTSIRDVIASRQAGVKGRAGPS